MTIKDAIFKVKELLFKNDDMMDQDDLFEAQDLIMAVCDAFEERDKKKKEAKG